MEATEKAYKEIFDVLKRHKDVCVFDLDALEKRAKNHLFGLELKLRYGLDIEPKEVESSVWINFGNHKRIGWWGEKHNRSISWSVDGSQPIDDLLLEISFPTGAYIFGQDYPKDLFERFWLELKSFNPNYMDENNRCLYWTMENAKDVFNSFDSLLKKYYEINKDEFKSRQVAKLKNDLTKLENN